MNCLTVYPVKSDQCATKQKGVHVSAPIISHLQIVFLENIDVVQTIISQSATSY